MSTPVALRGRPVRNPLVLAALTNTQSHTDGSLGDDELRWLARRAEGGFGVVTTCAAFVSPDGKAWQGQLGVHDDAMLPGLTRLATAVKEPGALALAQLHHGGVRADEDLIGHQTISASEVATGRRGPPRAATQDDIARLQDAFVAAAVRCARAGFDGVEVHGAHGYLITQFLSPETNLRTDGWGGSLDHRARFLLEILERTRAAVPDDFVVGVRLTPSGMGITLDESTRTARWCEEAGADFVHASTWDGAMLNPAVPAFREVLQIPLIACGKVWTAADVQAVHDRGADLVAVGKAGIANPDWPRTLEAPRPPWSHLEAVGPAFMDYLRAMKLVP